MDHEQKPYARLASPGPLIDIGLNVAHRDIATHKQRLLRAALEAGVVGAVCTGTSVGASRAVLQACKQPSGSFRLFATVGVHPHEAKTFEGDKTVDALRRMILDNPGVAVAVGECGIDFDRMFSTREEQTRCFAAQLRLAKELNLPVFLHQRLGFAEFCNIMDAEWPAEMAHRAVVHCFTGNAEELKHFVKKGYSIGLTGLVCDTRRGVDTRKAISAGLLPLQQVMLETDAPFCSPKCIPNVPRKCEVEMLTYVAQDVASLMNCSFLDLCNATTRNVERFFGINVVGQTSGPIAAPVPSLARAELFPTSALAFVLEPSHPWHDKINAIRSRASRGDKAYPRWPPHINFFFPFVAESSFVVYRERLAACLQVAGSVEVRFDSIGYFPQRERYTFHLAITNEASLAALRYIFGLIAEAIPEVKPKFPTFVPHLTLAQCNKDEFDRTRAELQNWLGDGFVTTAQQLCMLSRHGRKLMTPIQMLPLGNNTPLNIPDVLPVPVPTVSMAKATAKPCRFFGTAEGCRKGIACQFRHA